MNAIFAETSALTSQNVEEVFVEISKKIITSRVCIQIRYVQKMANCWTSFQALYLHVDASLVSYSLFRNSTTLCIPTNIN